MLQDYELQRRLHSEHFSLSRHKHSKPLYRCQEFKLRNAIAVMKQLWFAMSLVTGACYSLLTPRPLPRPGRYYSSEPGQSVTELRAVIHQHQ